MHRHNLYLIVCRVPYTHCALLLGKLGGGYKGACGSIRAIEVHASLPYVASCGLDRYLRIHHVSTRKLVNKVCERSRHDNPFECMHL